ncbi:MAG: beta-lactamase domain protein [Thermomicrobiales bacterium]|jgi:glyoxylase-like metal-dependent hydrolase (beta-lactamase superfamily II)|nr:beta-lactamase domain protein [Thermomicrobiales bacterium]MDF3042320.1 beta-lactamase domain protein [Thermomicrobiales bacterium]
MSLEIVTIVGGPIQTNAYLVADAETGDALVIDAPYETASQIVEEAARRGWTIGQIIITHTHWDHILDATALQEATGVPLLAHPLAREVLANPAGNFGEPPVEIPPVEISETVDEGDTVTLGGHTFTVLHLPGHDPTHIGLFNDSTAGEEILLSGDVLFPGGHGTTEIPGADQAVTNETMRRLADELPATTTVMPGHGTSTTIGAETPWIRLLRKP